VACVFVLAGTADAKFKVLHTFTGGQDGANPVAGVTIDTAGNLFGTTADGGGTGCGGAGCGTVFKIAPNGSETVLRAFSGGSKDGEEPFGGVIEDASGNLYGTTFRGGSGPCGSTGCGTVFKIAADGAETILYAFQNGKDGSYPESGLYQSKAGNLYGTANSGGTYASGTVFEIKPDGGETTLYAFTGGNDGGSPMSSLVADHSGNLYGTTEDGGTNFGGVVFKLAKGKKETVLYSFTGGADGGNPFAGVIIDKSGNLYGTAAYGGANGQGNVFALTPDGTETVLYAFGGKGDGGQPLAGVINDKKGNLYGTTSLGGTVGSGVVFQLSPGGAETVLHAFTDGIGGAYQAGVIRDKSGNLYGTTYTGGSKFDGTVFEVKK
jgi:uncharacterized repeat protein (TIGR03803 family)